MVGEHDGLERGQVPPQVELPGGQGRTRDETAQRQHDGGLSRPHREQRAGGTGTAQLHTDGEHERAEEQSDAERPSGRLGRRPEESGAGTDDQGEQGGCGTQQECVGAQPGPVAHGDQLPPRRGEAEPGVEQGHPQSEPEQQQDAGLRAVRGEDVARQRHGDQQTDGERQPADGRGRRSGGARVRGGGGDEQSRGGAGSSDERIRGCCGHSGLREVSGER